MLTSFYHPDLITAVLIINGLILIALCICIAILVGVEIKVSALVNRFRHDDEMRIWRP